VTGPNIAVLAALDTKGPEAAFVRDRITAAGGTPRVVDIGLAGTPTIPADVDRGEVGRRRSAAPGASKDERMAAVAAGVADVLRDWLRDGTLDGVIGLGGGQGTWLCSAAMRELPLGLPKLLVSTVAHNAGDYSGHADIVFVPSVTDIAGLNPILRTVLARSAESVVAMSRVAGEQAGGQLVGVTMLGVTTAGTTRAVAELESAGFETAVFHANGRGGATLESAIAAGSVGAVLDFTIAELIDEVAGGRSSAGPDRLDAAARTGIPAVVVPGGIDVIRLHRDQHVPEGRVVHAHTPITHLLRSDVPENARLGELVGRKLRASTGPVRILVPEGGFSALDVPGGVFHDPAADTAFLDTLESAVGGAVPIERLPFAINDPEFAVAAARALIELVRGPAL
jgi:Uncharacterized conserved protein